MHRAHSVLFFGSLALFVAAVSCATGETSPQPTSTGTNTSGTGGNGGSGGDGGSGAGTTTSNTTTSSSTTSTTTTTTNSTSTTVTSTTVTTSVSSGGGCDMLTCLAMCFADPVNPCGTCVGNQCMCVPVDQCFPSGGIGSVGSGFPSGSIGSGFPAGVGGTDPTGVGGMGGASSSGSSMMTATP